MVGTSSSRVTVSSLGSPTTLYLLATLFFFSPILVLGIQFAQDFGASKILLNFDAAEIWWAFRNSLYLGLGSSGLAIFMGLVISFGIEWWILKSPRISGLIQQALLFPLYLPPFFVILTFFYWFDFFPLGKLANIVAQTMSYAGMAAVLLRVILQDQLAALSEMARVQGISRIKFFWISRQLVYRPVFALAIFIFALSFSSFSIPLILSGGRGTTLEILIYEKIRITQNFEVAMILAILQALFLGLLFLKVPYNFSLTATRVDSSSTRFFSSAFGAIALIVFLIFQYYPWIGQTPSEWTLAWNQITEAPDIWRELAETGLRSLSLSFAMMALVAGLAIFFIYQIIRAPLPKILRGYFPLSVSLVGFSGILVSGWIGTTPAYLLTFAILMFVSIFRLTIDPKLQALDSQIQVARVLGAKPKLIFIQVVWPQLRQEFATLLGMTFLWTLGDFAVARFFLPAGSTLTLLIESLMTSYRIQGAILLGLTVLFLGGLVQVILWRLFDVDRSQFKENL